MVNKYDGLAIVNIEFVNSNFLDHCVVNIRSLLLLTTLSGMRKERASYQCVRATFSVWSALNYRLMEFPLSVITTPFEFQCHLKAADAIALVICPC